MFRIDSLLPLLTCAVLAATAVGQTTSDRVVLEDNEHYEAIAYGFDLETLPAMSLTLKVTRIKASDLSLLAVTGGQPVASVKLLTSLDPARKPFDVDGLAWQLVGDHMLTIPAKFDSTGNLVVEVELGNPKLEGMKLFVQAVSYDDRGLTASNGLAIRVKKSGGC